MIDGLYKLRMITETQVRHGFLLKLGPLLLGRAGDRAAIGVIGFDCTGITIEFASWQQPELASPDAYPMYAGPKCAASSAAAALD